MCLNVKGNIEITNKPIICKKLVNIISENEWESIYYKSKNTFNIILNALDRNNLTIINLKINENNIITFGFHAFIDNTYLQSLIDKFGGLLPPMNIVDAIIPAGSEFCFGCSGDIVSNQIIVFSSKERFEEYLKEN